MMTYNPEIPVTTLIEDLNILNSQFAVRLKHGEQWTNLRPLAGEIRKLLEMIEDKVGMKRPINQQKRVRKKAR